MTVQMASNISFACCEHGSVWVRLHDETGAIFAAACMSPETGASAAEQIIDLVMAHESRAEPPESGAEGPCVH